MPGSLGDAYVNIIPKAPGISNQMEQLLGDGASSGGKSAGTKAGSALLGTLGKVVSVAAVGKIVKDAFSAGGDLEQSFGGLETIYGDAADAAKEYSIQAAAAGISANSYAEQAVSFGAALKQAFGGDTQQAMEAANMAIMDMADNSAKMGTDIGSVQAAYQGFAKQNYTMLDNLKLGYGGTKSEMERLIRDAEKLDSSFSVMHTKGKKGADEITYSYGDIVKAIHIMQGELGLTGVAAAEAETTLTGSFGALKASWTNLLAAMTTGEGLGAAMENLGKSAGNVLKNIVRMAGNIAKQLPALFNGLFNTIGPELMPAVTGIIQGLLTGLTTQLPQLLSGGTQMLVTIVQGIVQALPQLLSTAMEMIPTLLNGIISAIPQLLSAGSQILQTLVQGIITNLPQLLSEGAASVGEFIAGIVKQLPEIIATGVELLAQLAVGVIQAIPTLIMSIPQIFSEFASAFEGIDWASLGREIINGIISGISSAAGSLFESLKSLARNALDSAKEALGIGSPSKLFRDEVGKWIPAGVSVGIEDNVPRLTRQIQRMVDATALNMNRLQAAPVAATGGGGLIINQTIESVPQTPVQLAAATAAYFEQARWAV